MCVLLRGQLAIGSLRSGVPGGRCLHDGVPDTHLVGYALRGCFSFTVAFRQGPSVGEQQIALIFDHLHGVPIRFSSNV